MAPCQRIFRPWLGKEETCVPKVKISKSKPQHIEIVKSGAVDVKFECFKPSLSTPPSSPTAEGLTNFFHPAFLPPPCLPGLMETGIPKLAPSDSVPYPGFQPFHCLPVQPMDPQFFNFMVPREEVERVCAKRPRPKKFHCSDCGSSFSNKGQLKGHLRIHTGERPFACTHEGCGKKFTRNEELTRHRRIHSGARPFPCPLCLKRFGRKDHLKKHIRTHERPMAPQLPHFDRRVELSQYLTALNQNGFHL